MLLRDDLRVVLRLRHVDGHVRQALEALPAPHALQDVLGLLLSLAQPHVLAAHQLPDPRAVVTDPVRDVEEFIRRFNERFGDRHVVFYQGSYAQVRLLTSQRLISALLPSGLSNGTGSPIGFMT